MADDQVPSASKYTSLVAASEVRLRGLLPQPEPLPAGLLTARQESGSMIVHTQAPIPQGVVLEGGLLAAREVRRKGQWRGEVCELLAYPAGGGPGFTRP